jgi:hypothetical protein
MDVLFGFCDIILPEQINGCRTVDLQLWKASAFKYHLRITVVSRQKIQEYFWDAKIHEVFRWYTTKRIH